MIVWLVTWINHFPNIAGKDMSYRQYRVFKSKELASDFVITYQIEAQIIPERIWHHVEKEKE